MKRYLEIAVVFVLMLCVTGNGFAQFKRKNYQMKAKKKTLFQYDGRFLNHGWQFAPGLTYMFPDYFAENPQEFNVGSDSTLILNRVDASGKLGLYAEVGYFHLLQYGAVFQYLDYGLAFKQLKGYEQYTGQVNSTATGEPLFVTLGEGIYKESYAAFNFNMNNIVQLSHYSFLQNSIGFNVDYRVISKREYVEDPPVTKSFAPGLHGQLHYKLGFGRKVYDHFFMVFTLETPVLNVYPWDDFKSTLRYFNTQYRPVIFTVRFMLRRRPRAEDCPPVYNSPFDPAG